MGPDRANPAFPRPARPNRWPGAAHQPSPSSSQIYSSSLCCLHLGEGQGQPWSRVPGRNRCGPARSTPQTPPSLPTQLIYNLHRTSNYQRGFHWLCPQVLRPQAQSCSTSLLSQTPTPPHPIPSWSSLLPTKAACKSSTNTFHRL